MQRNQRLISRTPDGGSPSAIYGKAREYQAPSDELKEIQRRIIKNVLAEFELSRVAHGSVKGRSFRTNAESHLGASTVVNVDVRNFFPRVSYRRVFDMFRQDFGFGTEVASLLTKLLTFKGRLPTGAPTSPSVANALLTMAVDRPLQNRAQELDAAVVAPGRAHSRASGARGRSHRFG